MTKCQHAGNSHSCVKPKTCGHQEGILPEVSPYFPSLRCLMLGAITVTNAGGLEQNPLSAGSLELQSRRPAEMLGKKYL